MSTRSTVAYGDDFHLYDECMAGGTYLEIETIDFSVSSAEFRKKPCIIVRLPKELLDRMTIDGKPVEEGLSLGEALSLGEDDKA